MELYIGIMSGTSLDGIDVALVDLKNDQLNLVATYYEAYTQALREKIFALCHQGDNEINRLGELDVLLGKKFAEAIQRLLTSNSLLPEQITAIGSHGQTVRHSPQTNPPFTLQIGDPNTISALTNITTVADFRRKDLAYGGQGAPLVPAFHQFLFAAENKNRMIVNIGGIANISIFAGKNLIAGFDTGPGNLLLDLWAHKFIHKHYDANGDWARSGVSSADLLQSLLADDYFKIKPPKSTGREYFNWAWLEAQVNKFHLKPEDVQATLIDFTAITIINSVFLSDGEIIICGGGAKNLFLLERLQKFAGLQYKISSSKNYGYHPDWIEAMAFAYFAKQTLHKKTASLPQITGASQATIMGGIYF